MLEVNRIYNADCLDLMKEIDNNTINCVITSPPYYRLRNYSGSANELGQEETVELYLYHLYCIFDEVYRILKQDGALWVNIDDVYLDKKLACIPDRFKIGMSERGWICRNEIIWRKPNAMPSSVKDRFNNDYEKFYFFVKSKDYKFNVQYEPLNYFIKETYKNYSEINSKYENLVQEKSVRQGMSKDRGNNIIFKRYNLPSQEEFVKFLRSNIKVEELSLKSGINKTLIEHWFRKDKRGFSYPSVSHWNKVKDILNDNSDLFFKIDEQMNDITEETDGIMKNFENGKIKRSVWDICTKPLKEKHYASFPEDLCKIPISACSNENDIVLDPFVGSGTTCKVAYDLKRNYIGIEKVKEYYDIACERLNNVKAQLRLF